MVLALVEAKVPLEPPDLELHLNCVLADRHEQNYAEEGLQQEQCCVHLLVLNCILIDLRVLYLILRVPLVLRACERQQILLIGCYQTCFSEYVRFDGTGRESVRIHPLSAEQKLVADACGSVYYID